MAGWLATINGSTARPGVVLAVHLTLNKNARHVTKFDSEVAEAVQ